MQVWLIDGAPEPLGLSTSFGFTQARVAVEVTAGVAESALLEVEKALFIPGSDV